MKDEPEIVKQLKKEEKNNELKETYNQTKPKEKDKDNYKDIITQKNDIIDQIDDSIIITDLEGTIKYVNPACKKILGFQKEDLVGKNVTILEENDGERPTQQKIIEKTRKNGSWHGEVTNYDINGKKIIFEFRTFIIKDKKSNKKYMLGISRDITKRKEKEKKLQLSKQILNAIFNDPDTLLGIIDINGALVSANKTSLDYIDCKLSDVKGLKFWNTPWWTHSEKLQKRLKKAISKASKGKYISFEATLKVKNDDIITIDFSLRPIRDKKGRIRSLVAGGKNITERKQAEKELKKTKEKLEELNNNLEEKVEKRTKKIQHLLQQKDDFVNQIGHDLKNPLTPFVTLLPILEDKVDDEPTSKIIEVLEKNTGHMKKIVEKTITLAKLNSSKINLQFEKTNLKKEIDKNIKKQNIFCKKNDVEIKNNIEDDITVEIDKPRFEKLINNLLNNSVKYSKEKNGQVTINAEQNDKNVILSITDNGIGMNQEQINKLFNEFYKADPARHDFDSSGLGMPICKKIVEKHGGRIWAESPGLGKGTTYYIKLPNSKK
ncbi:MAG: PAS domain S-box protein [Candidatus Thermoplasmatota archaeon]